jgi:inward rectifier potassium channel
VNPPTPPPVRILNAPPTPLRDVFHRFMASSWGVAIGGLVSVYVLLNVVFAAVYAAIGGIANARPGSLVDALHFSFQTMGTIGYGAMYPNSPLANVVVDVESITGIAVTAVATGLMFAKLSRPDARIAFTRQVVISPMDGVPTLMVRIGNERGNRIVDVTIRMGIVRTERTAEGVVFYRMLDLVPVRERAPALSRSLLAMHRIDAGSPLYGETPETLKAKEVEVTVTISGLDDTAMQPTFAGERWTDDRIVWGARHADILSEASDGTLMLDVAKFHDVVATPATADFPYTHAPTRSVSS